MLTCGACFCSSRRRLSSALIVAGAGDRVARVAWVGIVGYGGCAGVAAAVRQGISSAILLMVWPSAILVRMSLR